MKRNTIKFSTAAIALLLLSLSTFGQSIPIGKWRLIAHKFDEQKEVVSKNSSTTLIIGRDGRVGGNTGCNVFGGEYTVEDGVFTIGGLISTMMACEEPSPEFEYKYLDVLRNATDFKIRKSVLTIRDPKTRNMLRFTPIK